MIVTPTCRLPRSLAVALAGAALILLLQAMPAILPALEYRRDALPGQPWRLITAHLVHVNWTHALANAAAWVVLARLFGPRLDATRQALSLALGGLCVSLALAAFYPSISWYRGASGALHALFFAGATGEWIAAIRGRSMRASLLSSLLLAGGWIKVAVELPHDAATPFADWLAATTVPQAHLLGAIAGTVLGLGFTALRRAATKLTR
jgi:rhomboid family GlyGly-CTERM serine protease